jgi:hypothetical protein
VAVAATEAVPSDGARARGGWGSVVAAALALPGAAAAQLEPGPGPAMLSVKVLDYRDWQPDLERVQVRSPSLLLRLPLGERWGLEAGVTADSVSGASPRWHTAVSGASRFEDERRAGDVKVTRYDERSSWSLGLAASDENDFRSRALSATAQWASDDNNRSWSLGFGFTRDRIGSADDPTLAEQRRTVELAAGVTQALSRADLVQAQLTLARGEGYYDDPYKRPDQRPDERRQTILALRWNHHFEDAEVTLRSSYRHYRDSFGIRSHTLQLEPVFTPIPGVALLPSLRLYTQRAASFYFDPLYSYIGEPYPPGYGEGLPRAWSADQRLSGFGAVTLGFKLVLELGDGWSTDLRIDRYEQRGDWRIGGPGSPGLAPFSARFAQWGLTRWF